MIYKETGRFVFWADKILQNKIVTYIKGTQTDLSKSIKAIHLIKQLQLEYRISFKITVDHQQIFWVWLKLGKGVAF